MSDPAAPPRPRHRSAEVPAGGPAAIIGGTVAVIGEALGIVVQVALVWLAWRIVWDDTAEEVLFDRVIWCILATAYLGATILALNVLARSARPEPRTIRLLVGHPVARFISILFTFGSSLTGLTVALELIVSLGHERVEPIAEASAVWAMLLSWAMFNWGYARIYFSRYHRAQDPPLQFPGTDDPRLVDFVYLAFTNATTFAVSDVKVLATRMRWTIVWHTCLAFFFNALIIVLTMNVIGQGRLLAEIFD